MINGKLDKSVPYQGGPPGGLFKSAWDGTPTKPALEQAVFWAGSNGCTGSPVKTDAGTHTRWQYHCPAGLTVELHLVNDNGHAWPGGQKGSALGDKPSPTFNGTDVIWDFFKAHTK
jgi:polyhydroxybutyrate depolymerase